MDSFRRLVFLIEVFTSLSQSLLDTERPDLIDCVRTNYIYSQTKSDPSNNLRPADANDCPSRGPSDIGVCVPRRI